MQSPLGLLTFPARVIPMGRTFSKRPYRSTCGIKSPFARIRLTKLIKHDLRVWLQFVQNFNGHSLWQEDFVSADALNLIKDAAGSFGYGAYFDGHWSSECWTDVWSQLGLCKNIVLLEHFPVLVALTIWGEFFKNRRILLHSTLY